MRRLPRAKELWIAAEDAPWLSTALLMCRAKLHKVGKNHWKARGQTISVAHKGLEIHSCSHLQSGKTS